MKEEEATSSGITIFAGRFGSGKTEVAINFAISLASCSGSGASAPGVFLIDLDVVTPYFRLREMAQEMSRKRVQVIAPAEVGHYLDTPAITPQILGAIQQPIRPVVIDVGGDKQGARVLGLYSASIRQRGYTLYFVVNPYRPFTDTLEGLVRSISEIEAGARLQVSSLVSNPNLREETTFEHIRAGHARIEGFAKELGLSIAFIGMERRWAESLRGNEFQQPVLALDRHFVMAWEQTA